MMIVRMECGDGLLEKQFEPDMLYNRIVHYYIDRHGYSKARANSIAQTVVRRETARRICGNGQCGHMSHDHIRNAEVCLVAECGCRKFTRGDPYAVRQ